jgi:hypothetical protein
MQDLLKMMQEQLEALQASRSGPVPTKARFIVNTHFQCCSILRRRARASAAICLPCLCLCNNVLSQVVVVTPRIFITIPSGQSMEYGTMELPPRVIRQLVTQQVTKRFDCIIARVE